MAHDDEFARMAYWLWENRKVRIITGDKEGSNIRKKDPDIIKGIFALNLGKGDMYGLENIPQTEDHSILLGAADNFRGRGAGKVNQDGAEQAKKESKKIVGTIREYGNVYSADAILVIASTAGGTGSGSVGVIVDMLKDEFKKPVYAMLVLPFRSDYDDADSVVNTATCLKRVLENSKADAVFIIDNERFVRKSDSMKVNYLLINRRIVDSFMDILSVGEETGVNYIGEVLDANDLIRVLKGHTAIGVSFKDVPPRPKEKAGIFGRGNPRHISATQAQIERARNAVDEALGELSVGCDFTHKDSGLALYDAGGVIGLFSGPAEEATEEIISMMDSVLAEKVPDAKRRKGTYPGRSSNTIGVTVILTDIGEGALMDQVKWFYEEALKYKDKINERSAKRKDNWGSVKRVGEDLPSL